MSIISANDFTRTIASGVVPVSTNSPKGYQVPGLHVEDHEALVPLDWRGVNIDDPASVKRAIDEAHLTVFYRVVCAAENEHRDLPLLVFLQGGPGGKSPRPLTPSSDGWIAEAVRHFRVVLPDQRGTGRSSAVDGRVIRRIGRDGFEGLTGPEAQAAYLHRFYADSIVRDFEWVRRTGFAGRKWASEGQSYGGFLTLTYLSLFPQALTASFTTGGIPAVPADPHELYAHTFRKVCSKVQQYYERYPQDAARLAQVADRLSKGDVRLPNGDPFSVARLQSLGSGFGMKPGFERVHWLLDDAFDGNGELSTAFLMGVMNMTSSYGDELYWTLQEGIYEDGGRSGECQPSGWAAEQEIGRHADLFVPSHRPLMLTGEMARRWMFAEDSSLKPFADAEEILMSDTRWGRLYDPERLRNNTVPLQAAVYAEDMYVPVELSLRTLDRIGNSHRWVTNSFQHDGVHGDFVWRHLYELASQRGDLAGLE